MLSVPAPGAVWSHPIAELHIRVRVIQHRRLPAFGRLGNVDPMGARGFSGESLLGGESAPMKKQGLIDQWSQCEHSKCQDGGFLPGRDVCLRAGAMHGFSETDMMSVCACCFWLLEPPNWWFSFWPPKTLARDPQRTRRSYTQLGSCLRAKLLQIHQSRASMQNQTRFFAPPEWETCRASQSTRTRFAILRRFARKRKVGSGP